MGELELQDSFCPYFDCGKEIEVRVQRKKARRVQRARSATSASSTTMPAGVARKPELPTGATKPSS